MSQRGIGWRSRGLGLCLAGASACLLACGGEPGVEAEQPPPFHLVVIGSSTAAGFGASDAETPWAARLENTMAELAPAAFTLTNLAVGGHTTADLQPGSGTRGNV